MKEERFLVEIVVATDCDRSGAYPTRLEAVQILDTFLRENVSTRTIGYVRIKEEEPDAS